MVKAALLTVLIGYLLGNVNGSVIISHLVANDDVRRHGSGNAGFTNFFRNYGRRSAVIVMVIDLLKTVAACFIGRWLFGAVGYAQAGAAIAGLSVSLGHDFPALLDFRGGKGIVCGLAAATMVDWRLGVTCLVSFAAVYLPRRMVSLGSVVAAVCFGIMSYILYSGDFLIWVPCVIIALLAVFMHRTNIKRLLDGVEKPTDFFGKGGKK